jgi:hypothetical protein
LDLLLFYAVTQRVAKVLTEKVLTCPGPFLAKRQSIKSAATTSLDLFSFVRRGNPPS